MKKKLEIMLEKLEKFSGKAELEQYSTPASIASDILWYAYQHGDIKGKLVIDLGCGNGIFAIGAALLGAKAIGVDIDEEAIKVAKKNADVMNVDATFIISDIELFNLKGDVVIMNPPFGAQYANRKADRKFLGKAMEIASVIYSLHLERSIEFIQKIVTSRNFSFEIIRKYKFPIKAMMPFHRKRMKYFDVVAINARNEKIV